MINQGLFQSNGRCGYHLKHNELPTPKDPREVIIRLIQAVSVSLPVTCSSFQEGELF